MTSIAVPGDSAPAALGPASTGLIGVIAPLLPAVLLLYAALLPPEFRLQLFDQNIYAPRMVAFLLLPWIIYGLANGSMRIRWLDGAVVAGAVWMIISFSVYYDPATGFRRAGAMALDVLAPYFIARLCITNPTDFRRTLILAAPVIALEGCILLVEGLGGQHLARPFAASLFGPIPFYDEGIAYGAGELSTEFRLGFLRAYGTFTHPIHAGLFMASLIPIFALSGVRGLPLYLGVTSGVFAFFSGSSAAYLTLALALALIAFDKVQRSVGLFGWRPFVALIGLAGFAAQVGSKNGLVAIVARNTLNPQSAGSRIYIWDTGTKVVSQNPWFGIGFSDYDQYVFTGASVDNYWLLLALRHGYVTPLMFMLVALAAIVALGAASGRTSAGDRSLYVGIAISLALLVLAGFTVAFLGALLAWFFVLLGAAMSLTQANQPSGGPAASAAGPA